MKFFTRSWTTGDLTDAEFEAVPGRYQDHLAAISARLSDPVRELANRINLHDGLIREIRVDNPNRNPVLLLRCGDVQVGYFDLDLHYGGADVTPELLSQLEALATDSDVELLYDEVDVDSDGVFIHRILFGPTAELELRFRDLSIEVRSKPNREITRRGLVLTAP